MSVSDYYYDEINSEENLQELDNQEPPSYDEYKEQRAGFDAFTNKESNMHGKWTKENFNEFHK